ncbi:hypothetical protein SLEP1_g36897 [Rubroshorea leprosula]|uniref:Cytochrome P450 n=1 Tax=Rubroshorea leprosula TaxID=152421 RepID=A0AAV5KTE6_9ROSI|nr:hypothetical protein SLEP1_g36897 [Rubroshorea leprosula]
MSSPLTLTIFAFPFFFFLLWISKFVFKSKRSAAPLPPQAGGAWPVIGHLHLLGGSQPAHIILGNMVDRYGPIFTIKLGVHKALVVSDSKTAKECFTTNDKVFANRPNLIALESMSYNNAMFGFAPYGPYWRHVRKIATLELLSGHRLKKLKHVQESVIRGSLHDLYQLWSMQRSQSNKALVEMKKWFAHLTINVILKIIAGKQVSNSSDRWMELLKEFFEYSGKFLISDAFPFLRWLDIGGEEKAAKKIAKELDQVVMEWLEEHKSKKISCGEKKDEDFMDVMLSILNDVGDHDADTINKATSLGLILAGSDTTAVTLTWVLSLLLNNRDALKKVQDELDTHVGKDKKVEESDINNLLYLHAVIKETMRLYPAGPLSVPHESMEDCTVSGYHIPAGTRLFVNIYKIHRDPKVWSDPYEFRPERFLTGHKDVDFRGQDFELIPFGSGRRMCPGVTFALQVMQLSLANLLHMFEFSTPLDEQIDMSEGVGMTNLKSTPLEVLISPRLPPSVFELN